jgi:cell division protease FtsH
MRDFEFAKDKVIMGAERRSMIISDHEKKTTAYHEAGHALVAILLPGTDPVHKVTIIPRGRALGVTQQLPSEDRLSMTKDYAEKRIAILMGGRIAEEIIFDQLTTGAGQDIVMATDTARSMVCEWGMSLKLGPLAYGKKNEQVFLGRGAGGGTKDYSEQTAREIDNEIHRIVTEGYDRARKLIEENMDALEGIAQGLLEFETLDASDVKMLADGSTLDDLRDKKDSTNKREKEADERQKKLNSKREAQQEELNQLIEAGSKAIEQAADHLKLSDDAAKLIQTISSTESQEDKLDAVSNLEQAPAQSSETELTETDHSDSDDDLPPSLLGPRK